MPGLNVVDAGEEPTQPWSDNRDVSVGRGRSQVATHSQARPIPTRPSRPTDLDAKRLSTASSHHSLNQQQCPTPPLNEHEPFPSLDGYESSISDAGFHFGYPESSNGDFENGSRPPSSVNKSSPPMQEPPTATLTNLMALESSPTPTQAKSPSLPPDGMPKKPRSQSGSSGHRREGGEGHVRKLSASQMHALTASPDSLPVAVVPPGSENSPPVPAISMSRTASNNGAIIPDHPRSASVAESAFSSSIDDHLRSIGVVPPEDVDGPVGGQNLGLNGKIHTGHPNGQSATLGRPPTVRTVSTPPISRVPAGSSSMPLANARRNSLNPTARPPPLNLGRNNNMPQPSQPPSQPQSASGHKELTPRPTEQHEPRPPSPRLPTLPLPPMSLPTHLQLELATQKPSPLYIQPSQASDVLFESSAVKFERLLNVMWVPVHLENLLFFGTLACLDAWLYTFTILPIRFCIAAMVLVKWWISAALKEMKWIVGFVWHGVGRLWRRTRRGRTLARDRADSSQAGSESERSVSRPRESAAAAIQHSGVAIQADGRTVRRRGASDVAAALAPITDRYDRYRYSPNGILYTPRLGQPKSGAFRHRRTHSTPSSLTQSHKADLLQGAIIICSSVGLCWLDASRMYHFIRAQSSMKLYVIYNMLEVGDRLLSALGQDIFECLFSSETLSRNSLGRSKILMPFGMFVLSLIYNMVHVFCLFYQCITLNVAVNSYSDSLFTLLISNQFTEIKGAVFKKIEKENLFQLTCADIVERFQLWILLLIIGLRNIVEVGGLSIPFGDSENSGSKPLHTSAILPASFTVLPSWFSGFLSGEVLSPFILVIIVEMGVDYIKHAYINKFNNVRPTVYKRMLDILCKDYYTNAFSTPSLIRRIGLPVIPLSCFFIRAMTQIYHMFLATRLPPPLTPTGTMDLSEESSTPSSKAMVAALDHLDTLIRNALGRAVYGYPYASPHVRPFWSFSSDDLIAYLTMALFFFLAWVILLIVKLLLGMVLLGWSRKRFAAMQARDEAVVSGQAEHDNHLQPGKRIGSWGAVEVGDERRRWLYEDDKEGLRRMRERERKTDEKVHEKGPDGLAKAVRYELGSSKRIW